MEEIEICGFCFSALRAERSNIETRRQRRQNLYFLLSLHLILIHTNV